MNLIRIIILIALSIFLSVSLSCQSDLFEYHTFKEGSDSLNYRLLISDYDTTSKYPLVIFLHGSGERELDNEAQLKWGVRSFTHPDIMGSHRPIVLAPQCPPHNQWGNYDYTTMRLQDKPTMPMRLLLNLIRTIITTRSIDTDRIYITGLSMGGYGTFDALYRAPDLFAAAIPVCGAGDTSKASTFAQLPMWIVHGMLDDLVPYAYSMQIFEAITSEGGRPGLTLYPDTGHFSWIAAYSDMKLINWMFAQRK